MKIPRTIAVVDRTSGALLGSQIRVAETTLSRLVGLLGTTRLSPGHGLLIVPSSGVHTLGMKYPIDVVALDCNMRVCRIWETLPPARMTTPSWNARCVLELPAGTIGATGIAVGDQLEVVQHPNEQDHEGVGVPAKQKFACDTRPNWIRPTF
jgi:hypothetical protein